MTHYFLGVDIGNTKSHALISDEHGRVIGVGVGGSGNHESLGKAGFRRVLAELTAAASASAGITGQDIAAAGYGIAGYDWSEDTPLVHEVIESLDVSGAYDAVNDAELGLWAGSSNGWGISIAAGTSVNGRGRDAHGNRARMTGNGLRFGEAGGGVELVGRAIIAIARAWSMRGPQTALTETFIEYAGAKSAEDLLAGIARGRYTIHAAAAPLVFRVADAGDAAATNAIRWIGEGLGDVACGLIRQLNIGQLAFDVVLSGSLYQASPLIQACMREVVYRVAPQARFVHLQAPPVTGAVMLAMKQGGIDYMPLRERIITSGRALLVPDSETLSG